MGELRPVPGFGVWTLAVIWVCGLAPERIRAQGAAPAPAGRAFTIASNDGRRLDASGFFVRLLPPGAAIRPTAGFSLEPIDEAQLELHDGEAVRMRSSDGRWLARLGGFPYLSSHERLAVVWSLERVAGEGVLALGDQFRIRARRDQAYLGAGHASARLSRTVDEAVIWTVGCYFEAGPFVESWTAEPEFQVATGEYGSRVAEAVDWLRANTLEADLPSGRFPLVVWDDPTLAPEPTVAYVMIDTLWASKALQPYEPDLAAQMASGLLSIGWYGNGLADTLFHAYAEPAHRPSSADFVHGTLLDRCVVHPPEPEGTRMAQVRVPEQLVDPAWTDGNSAQFVDSAVYTALNDHWNGRTEEARSRLRDVIVRTSPDDVMFWDAERWVMVDQASRCEYDAFAGECSSRCATCAPCLDLCFYFNASFKLGLLLYAARVTGLATEALVMPHLAQMEYRLWESQNEDGGIPHVAYYAAPGLYFMSSGATGEATSISVLANTVTAP